MHPSMHQSIHPSLHPSMHPWMHGSMRSMQSMHACRHTHTPTCTTTYTPTATHTPHRNNTCMYACTHACTHTYKSTKIAYIYLFVVWVNKPDPTTPIHTPRAPPARFLAGAGAGGATLLLPIAPSRDLGLGRIHDGAMPMPMALPENPKP